MIHTLTMNPAIDKLIYIRQFSPNITNRIKKVEHSLGGKGTHVSVNLAQMDITSCAHGICFGSVGNQIMQSLEEAQVKNCFLHYDNAESRTNYLILDRNNGDCTILAEPGITVSKAELEKMLQKMEETIEENDILVLSGDASNCFDESVYNIILQKLKKKKLHVFLDTSGPVLKQCVKEKPYLIKPNLDELSFLSGRQLLTIYDVVTASRELQKRGVSVVATSLGGDGSVVCTEAETIRAYAPKIQIKNTIGCGDAYLSGLLAGFDKKMSMQDTVRLATAISAACAMSNASVGFAKEDAESLFSAVKIENL